MTEKSISTKTFYNSETKKKYLQFLKERRSNSKPNSEPIRNDNSKSRDYKSCFGEHKIWKYVHRQQHAIDYINQSKDVTNICLFAVEKEDSKRKFLVTTQKQFWLMYKDIAQNERHFYEVIRDNKPCRLYFDIEYLYEYNGNVNAVEVLETFIQFISYCLYVEYNIKCLRKHYVDLDSSTDKKFSRHLILHLHDDEVLFANNYHCGEFVKEICAALELYVLMGQTNKYIPVSDTYTGERDKLNDEILKNLYINTDNKCAWIFDQSVYSKNRNFRLYLSRKFSKNATLQIAKENKFDVKRKLSRLETQIYKIRNIKFDAEFQFFQDTLICPCSEIRKSKSVLQFTNKGEIIKMNSTNPMSTSFTKFAKNCVKGSKKSDYPALDAFVLSHVNKNGSNQGWIRRWLCYDTSQLMIYDIDGNRYCGNIHREHKSNHTYYIADLTLNSLYQKCFDPDCWNYRSEGVTIPDEINPFNKSVIHDDVNVSQTEFRESKIKSRDEFRELTDFEFGDIFEQDFDFINFNKDDENSLGKQHHSDHSCRHGNVPTNTSMKHDFKHDFNDSDIEQFFDDEIGVI